MYDFGRIFMAPISAFAAAIIIVLSVLLPAAIWLGVDRYAGAKDRPLVSPITAALLVCWTFAAIGLCISGTFQASAPKLVAGRSNAVPLIGSGVLIMLVLFFAVGPFRRTLNAVPHAWLVGAQLGR